MPSEVNFSLRTISKAYDQPDPHHWRIRKLQRSALSWFTRRLRYLKRCLQTGQLLPAFYNPALSNMIGGKWW